jgi:hypothetical protein
MPGSEALATYTSHDPVSSTKNSEASVSPYNTTHNEQQAVDMVKTSLGQDRQTSISLRDCYRVVH